MSVLLIAVATYSLWSIMRSITKCQYVASGPNNLFFGVPSCLQMDAVADFTRCYNYMFKPKLTVFLCHDPCPVR